MSAAFLASPLLAAPHGFFTRCGGVSRGPYASLNCSLSGGDDPEAVATNRGLAAAALDAAPADLVGLKQVHGKMVIRVQAPWRPGEGPDADSMVSNTPGVALGIVTADCAPVLFHHAAAGVVGAAHAGWRGAVTGVLEATVEAMTALDAVPGRIVAAIGPCITQASYEVGTDVRDAVLAATPGAAACFAPGAQPERWQFDLAGYCLLRLKAAGVLRCDALRVDTLANEDRFFSHRRRTLAGGGSIGHQISVIRA